MVFRLWHKLVLTIAGITGVVLILALYISDQSVKKGFLAYINQVEENRLGSLEENLVEGYAENQNWDFIKNNRRLWHRYNRRTKSPLPRGDRLDSGPPMPLLRAMADKGDKAAKPPHLSGHRPPPPPRGEDGNRKHPPGGRRPPGGNLALLDSNKEFVIGRRKLMQSPEAKLKPIRFNHEVIGYIQYKSFTKFTDELDKQFIQYQNHAFLKIALLALALILLGTGLLAAYLRSRINRIGDHAGLLTSGDFSPQTLDKSADELGQLSNKLNLLGKTLADNQLSRQRWVSDISHELRTPVAVLQGEIEAIQDGVRKLTPASIDSLHHEILRLSRLVNDLHDLSMSDMGALSYDKASTDIVELIEEVITSHQAQFDEKQIKVTVNSSQKEMNVIGDWQRLEQLFSNLANNSRHYTSQAGSLHVDIRKQKNNVLIQWADSSPGVEDKDLSKLFDRLYRVDSSRNRNTGGSGLGLAICKNIVEAHDGEIVASHSDLGGVLFSISFPLLKK